MRRVWGIAKADYLERSRRFSFIAMIALALFAAFCFVPDNSSLNVIVIDPEIFVQGGHPTWMTIASAWGLTVFLPILGFFYVSGSLSYDETVGVSDLAKTSPSAGLPYILGKFLSGAFLLYSVLLAVLLGSVVMMLIKFPGQFPSLYSVVSPYLVFLPNTLLITALAILYDSTRFLRKSLGAVAYVFAFFSVLLSTFVLSPVLSKALDFTGTKLIGDYIGREVLSQTGKPMEGLRILAGPGRVTSEGTKILIFHGIDWQWTDICGLLLMTMIALAIVVLSAQVYKATDSIRLTRPSLQMLGLSKEAEQRSSQFDHYTPRTIPLRHNIVGKLFAEMKLTLAGMPLLWKLAALGGIIVCALLPLESAQSILPLMMLWLLGVYSAMGCREHIHHTLKYIAIIPGGLLRQITLSWLSGIFISLILAGPVILRMLAAGEYSGIFVSLCGLVFIPSLALFLGEWSHTRRAFEVIYVTTTYLAMNGMTGVAYLEVRPDVLSIPRAVTYLSIGIVLGILAVMKRIGLVQRITLHRYR